jgi:hypothetical protein
LGYFSRLEWRFDLYETMPVYASDAGQLALDVKREWSAGCIRSGSHIHVCRRECLPCCIIQCFMTGVEGMETAWYDH